VSNCQRPALTVQVAPPHPATESTASFASPHGRQPQQEKKDETRMERQERLKRESVDKRKR
jgi:hypothetical protein